MRTATITLHKDLIDKDIDAGTYKRTDATLEQASLRAQNAVSSDASENVDGLLIARYRDVRDAKLRERLKFCLIQEENETLVADNSVNILPEYVYNLRVDDQTTAADVKSISTMMHNYLVRGVLFDWYAYMGLQPIDSVASLEEMIDDIAGALRGRSYGRRPMQPFGPAFNPFNEEI